MEIRCIKDFAGAALIHPRAGPLRAVWLNDHRVTRADFDAHVCSAEYRLLLAVIDLSATPPEISFDDVDPIGGLGVLTALRSSGVADHQIEPGK